MDNSERLVNELMRSILPFGYLDVKAAAELLEDAQISFCEFWDYVDEHTEELWIKYVDLDLCGIAYEFVLQQARIEIEEETEIDILDFEVYTYGNFMCSQYDKTEEALEAAKKVEEPSALLKAFIARLE